MGEVYSESRPFRSLSMAIPAHQVERANARLKEHGAKLAHYNRDGTFEATSKQSMRIAQKIRNIQNNDAGYSDVADS